MLRRLKRPRSTLNELTPEHESQGEGSQADHGLGVGIGIGIGMNSKRVRWDSPSDLQDEHDSSNSDSSGLTKVAS